MRKSCSLSPRGRELGRGDRSAASMDSSRCACRRLQGCLIRQQQQQQLRREGLDPPSNVSGAKTIKQSQGRRSVPVAAKTVLPVFAATFVAGWRVKTRPTNPPVLPDLDRPSVIQSRGPLFGGLKPRCLADSRRAGLDPPSRTASHQRRPKKQKPATKINTPHPPPRAVRARGMRSGCARAARRRSKAWSGTCRSRPC